MKTVFQITLSSDEIAVLSALMGYTSVPGPADNMICPRGAATKEQVTSAFSRLEQKKLIRNDLSGTLYVLPHLRTTINCICTAERISLFSSNIDTASRRCTYILNSGEHTVLLEETGSDRFSLSLVNDFSIESLIPKRLCQYKGGKLSEKLLYEEAEKIHTQIVSFDADGAFETVVRRMTESSSAAAVYKILCGDCPFISFRTFIKDMGMYRSAACRFAAIVDDACIAVRIDEQDVISFESDSPDAFIRDCKNSLSARCC